MDDKRIDEAARIVVEEANRQKMTRSDLFYRYLEKSDQINYVESEVILRACEMMEDKLLERKNKP